MHKYDKRFTGGNQIAYENKYKLPHRKITNSRHSWDYIRQQFRQLSQGKDEDAWDNESQTRIYRLLLKK